MVVGNGRSSLLLGRGVTYPTVPRTTVHIWYLRTLCDLNPGISSGDLGTAIISRRNLPRERCSTSGRRLRLAAIHGRCGASAAGISRRDTQSSMSDTEFCGRTKEPSLAMGSSPVVLAILLFLASLAITLFSAHHAPWHHLPVWWDLHGNPWIYGPRWLVLLFVPVLTLLVPVGLNWATVTNNIVQDHGAASNQSVFNIVVLPALYLFIIQTYVILPAESDSKHKFPARIFVSNTALWVLIWFGHNLKHLEPNNVIGIISPWTTNASWDIVHLRAGLIFEISGVLLFIASFVVPLGWPMLITLLFFWLGPWVISFGFAYSKSASTSEPLLSGDGN